MARSNSLFSIVPCYYPLPTKGVVTRPPPFLLLDFLRRLFKLHLANFPTPELDYLQYNSTVDGSRFAREVGFTAQHSLKETIRAAIG